MSNAVTNYILIRKKSNPELSCRTLCLETSKKFNINISKSSVNSVLKHAKLSSPVGRRVEQAFRPSGETTNVGFSMLFGANLKLGLSTILAKVIHDAHPGIKLNFESLEAISEAWIMAKAIYNVPLEKIENYSKNEMWFITGRKANKGYLKYYVESMKMLQTINNQIVMELTNRLQDIHFLKFFLADGTQFYLDGQLKSVWNTKDIPLNFSVTYDKSNTYINNLFSGQEPVLIFSARPETVLTEEINSFIFCFDGSSTTKRLRKIEAYSPKGEVLKEASFVIPERRRFIIGIWPWQYKPVVELEKKETLGRVILEPLGAEIHFTEDNIRFSQHIHNIEVTLRLIILKSSKNGPARLGLLTNLDPSDWDIERIVETYVRDHPDFEAEHRIFLEAVKSPLYFEDFISSEKIINQAKKINDACDPDALFACLVEVLNMFAQRTYFPSECSRWSLLKMRELFYKKNGFIKRDMAQDVLYKLFIGNILEEKKILISASTKFNSSCVEDYSKRKLWLLLG